MSGAVDRGFCIRMDLPGLPFLFIAASQTPLATVLTARPFSAAPTLALCAIIAGLTQEIG
jgi:hypothetical protein